MERWGRVRWRNHCCHSSPDHRTTLGTALIERAAFWYQLLVLKFTAWLTVLRCRAFFETDRFTTRRTVLRLGMACSPSWQTSVLVSYSLGDLWSFLCACLPCQLQALDLRFEPRPKYRGVRWVFKAIADERRIIVFDVHIEFADVRVEEVHDFAVIEKRSTRQHNLIRAFLIELALP